LRRSHAVAIAIRFAIDGCVASAWYAQPGCRILGIVEQYAPGELDEIQFAE
jgi:hypothetical protein